MLTGVCHDPLPLPILLVLSPEGNRPTLSQVPSLLLSSPVTDTLPCVLGDLAGLVPWRGQAVACPLVCSSNSHFAYRKSGQGRD